MIKISFYKQNTYYTYIYIYIIFIFFYNLSDSCLFCLVAIVMDFTNKHLINHSYNLVLAILYIHMNNIFRTNLYV